MGTSKLDTRLRSATVRALCIAALTLALAARAAASTAASTAASSSFLMVKTVKLHALEDWEGRFLRVYAPYAVRFSSNRTNSSAPVDTPQVSAATTQHGIDRDKEQREGFRRLRDNFGVVFEGAAGEEVMSYLPSLDKPFFFFHVPKTGGTSLREFLFRDFLLYLLPPPPSPETPPCVEEETRKDPVAHNKTESGRDPLILKPVNVTLNATQSERNESARVQWALEKEVESVQSEKRYRRGGGAAGGHAESPDRWALDISHTQKRRLDDIVWTLDTEKGGSASPPRTSPTLAPTPCVSTPTAAPFYSENDPRGSVLAPCYNCECDFEISRGERINQTACAVAFLGHFYPYPMISELHRIHGGVRGPAACSRWSDLRRESDEVQLRTRTLTAQDSLFWHSLDRSLCTTVVRNPFSRAISGYYEFGFPATNLTAREYIESKGVLDFLYISSSYVNAQTGILGGEEDPTAVNQSTLNNAKRVLEHCIVGVQEDMPSFVYAISQLFAIPPKMKTKMKRWNTLQTKVSNVPAHRLTLDMDWFRNVTSEYLSLDYDLWKHAQKLARRQKELLMLADTVRRGWDPMILVSSDELSSRSADMSLRAMKTLRENEEGDEY